MAFQLSYFNSWKIMLWKCCTQYASKFGKLSIGHRTGKCQFSFQSQRKAMPKNAQSESEVSQSCSTLWDPMDCSLWGFSIHGVFHTRVLEWVAISFYRGYSWLRARTQVPHIVGRRFTVWATREVCNPTPGHISGEKHYLKGYMCPNVHCSTVYNSQDMEAT